MYVIGNLIGGIIAIFILSKLTSVIGFRKLKSPKKTFIQSVLHLYLQQYFQDMV